jgi:hypothetical protein
MKQTDCVILEGLRKSVLADLPQVEWDMVVKAVVEAGDVRDVQGMARTIVFDAIEKASFASRSEAGRYAANQRWGNRMARAGAGSPPSDGPDKGRIAAEARWGAKGKKPFMDLTDIDPTGSMDKPSSNPKLRRDYQGKIFVSGGSGDEWVVTDEEYDKLFKKSEQE